MNIDSLDFAPDMLDFRNPLFKTHNYTKNTKKAHELIQGQKLNWR